MYRGVVTGLNEAFIIDEAKRAELIAADPRSAEVIKPYLRGRDVKRWQIDWAGLYIIFTAHGIDISRYPAIERYLRPFKDKLEARATSTNHQWYELQQPQMGIYPEFEKPKIVYPNICKRPEFTFSELGYYTNQKCFIIPIPDLCLLGILNSWVVYFLFEIIIPKLRGGFFEPGYVFMKDFPIPNIPDVLRQQIARVAQQCLDAAKDDPGALPALEAELNALVYQAYGLDEDDIRVIEENLA